MPNYTFRSKKTGKYFEKNMSYEEKLKYLKKNPNMESVIGRPAIGYRVLRTKPDDSFRDILRNINKEHQGAKVNTW